MSYLNYFFKRTKLGRTILDRRFKKMIKGKKEFKKEFINTDNGQEMIQEKIKELNGKMTKLNVKLNEIRFDSASCSDAEDWFYDWWIEDLTGDIKKLKSKIYRFNLMKKEEGMAIVSIEEDFDVDAIKGNVRIIDIIDRQPVQINGDRELYKCPFHEERNASFTVYRNQNSYYCFSCNSGGDVIQLYQKLNDVNFVEACKALSK